MIIRKGTQADLASVEQLYNDIHTAEETGQQTIGWIRGVYPTRATAQAANEFLEKFSLLFSLYYHIFETCTILFLYFYLKNHMNSN